MTYGNITSAATWQIPSLGEMRDMIEQTQAKMAAHRSQMLFDVMAMDDCCRCGHKAEYVEGPPELLRFCRCRVEAMKRRCESETGQFLGVVGAPSLMGFEIEIVD